MRCWRRRHDDARHTAYVMTIKRSVCSKPNRRQRVRRARAIARPGDVAPSIAVSVLIEPAGCALVRVVDTGMGIPEALQQRIFERFYRVPGSDQQGSGLGLAIVKRVMDLHGGQVRTVPRPEASGTVFELLLPMPAAARMLVPAA